MQLPYKFEYDSDHRIQFWPRRPKPKAGQDNNEKTEHLFTDVHQCKW